MAAVQQATPGQPGGGNAMAHMLPPGMSKEKVQEMWRVRPPQCCREKSQWASTLTCTSDRTTR